MFATTPSDVLVAYFILAILLCAAAGLLWAIFASPTAAELLEQQAEHDAAAPYAHGAPLLAEFRDSRPAALEMLRSAPACTGEPRRSCDQLGACNARRDCSACAAHQPATHQTARANALGTAD